MTASRAAVAAALLAFLHATSANADGDKPSAEALFQRAKALMAEGKFADACPKFLESDRLDPGIGTKLRLADCYALIGKTASAWAEFVDAADLATKTKDAREKIARQKAAELKPTLPMLTVEVAPGVPRESLEIRRDDVVIGAAVWGTPVPVDPGPHQITASAPGRKAWTSRVVSEPSRVTSILVPELDPEVVAAAPTTTTTQNSVAHDADPTTPAGGSAQRTIGVVVLGIGVLGLAGGTYFGLSAKSKLDASNQDGHCRADNRCDAKGVELRSDFQSAATISTIAFVVGGVAAVGGTVLFLTAPRGVSVAPAVSASAGGLVVRGSF